MWLQFYHEWNECICICLENFCELCVYQFSKTFRNWQTLVDWQGQVSRLRAEVCLDGYLQKTGSNKKGTVSTWYFKAKAREKIKD